MSKLKVYIAGPMRNRPNFNREAFSQAADRLHALGFVAFNPALMDEQNGIDLTSATGDMADVEAQGFNLGRVLSEELGLVCTWADAVCVLPEWEDSKGAFAEVAVARAVGKPVAYLEDFDADGVVRDAQDVDSERLLNSLGVAAREESICEEADRLVSTDRQNDYGRPIDNFTQTGRMWAAILGVDEVTAEEVGLCMIAIKVSRATNAIKRDTLVDIAGYAKTIDLILRDRANDAD